MTESDHKKAYQEYLKEKTFRTVVIYFAIKNKYFFYQICGRYIRCYVLPVIRDAWDTNQAGGLGKSRGWEGAGFAGKCLHKTSVLKYICFFKTF
jgi:hypothetical protein